ncbi:MAG: heme A synthase [Deltaproteobacteria bacterium]|nr:heme A synthase [Deltaproteobacteria bacterium]
MLVHRFALATSTATFLLLLVGGTVNPTGSSLACPDWPLCYGSLMPAMVGGVRFEHTHRLVAGLVALMTVGLAALAFRARPVDPALRRLGLLALAAVLIQATLGGITVLFKLPLAVSTAHLGLSMIFFVLLIYTAWRTAPAPGSHSAGKRALVGWTTAAVYAQILLGGLVRHTHSGRACSADIPWCLGQAWSSWGPAQLHMLHRYVGVLVAALVVAAAWSVATQALAGGRKGLLALALAAPVLVLTQIILGILSVTSGIGVVEVTAHLGVGALLLACLSLSFMALGTRPAPAFAPEGQPLPRRSSPPHGARGIAG